MDCDHRFILTGVLLCLAAAGCGRDAPAAPTVVAAGQATPRETIRVRITGGDYRWHIRYAGPDGLIETQDDVLTERHLHLPAYTDVRLELRSDDYVYSIYLPDYELVEMAFPGRPYDLELPTGPAGTTRLLGTQMCGFAHEELLGDLVVHERPEFDRWLGKQPSSIIHHPSAE